MRLEEIVTSVDISKKVLKLGIAPHSELFWAFNKHTDKWEIVKSPFIPNSSHTEYVEAFTANDLLPYVKAEFALIRQKSGKYHISYFLPLAGHARETMESDNLSEIFAEILFSQRKRKLS